MSAKLWTAMRVPTGISYPLRLNRIAVQARDARQETLRTRQGVPPGYQGAEPFVWFVAAGLALLCTAAPAVAHHGFSSEYDEKKPVTLTGVVTKLEWTNPHARFYIDVKDANGKVTTWNFELASVNSMRRNGWTQFTLKVGDVVTAIGYAALAGVPMANASSVRLADGTRLFAETSAPSVQQTPSAQP